MPLFLFMHTRGLHAATSMAMGDLGGRLVRSLREGDLGGRHGPSLWVGALGGRHELALLSIRRFCKFAPCLVINQEIPYVFIPQHCSLILGILLLPGFQKKEILPPTRGSHYL